MNMLKLICSVKHISICRISLTIFFLCFLMLGLQCLYDFLNGNINKIYNIKIYAIVFTTISIIGILCSCIICEDEIKDNIINKRNLITINEKTNTERERLI
jgi:hypothetical protein